MEGGKAEPGGPSTSPPRGGERDSRSACLPSASLEPAGFPPEEEPAAPLRPAVPHRILGGNGGGGCCSSSSLQAGSNRPCHQGRRRRRRRREEGGEEVRPLTLRNKGPGSGRRLRADSLMAAAAAQRRTPHAPSAGAAPRRRPAPSRALRRKAAPAQKPLRGKIVSRRTCKF